MPPAPKPVQVTLAVPAGRQGCVAWLKTQTPERTADLLEAVESLYGTVATISATELERAHAKEVEGLRSQHEAKLHELAAAHVEERTRIEAANETVVLRERETANAYRLLSERLQTTLQHSTDDGDEVLKHVHDQLQLGVLRKVGDDIYRWEHTASGIQGVCLLDPNVTDDKLRALAATDHVNAILVFGLRARVPGKSKMHLETLDHVRVLWASRSPHDALTAHMLVELAFTTYVNYWGAPTAAMTASVANLETLLPSVLAMETALRDLQGKLRGLLQGNGADAPEEDVSPHAFDELVQTLREHHRQKKRHARSLAEIGRTGEAYTVAMFDAALKTLKSENYRQAAAKRKLEDVAPETGKGSDGDAASDA
jgi:hypothetical protein